jgi:cytidylate kinase
VSALRVVAIDGAAGSGKSTLARGLARALGVAYVNTGVMYRALTFLALEERIDPEDGDALATLMGRLRFGLSAGSPPELEVEGSPPGPELESDSVEATVSTVASHPQVRALMREAQRALGWPDAVVEGRDIATVVFPDAPVKLYLTASASTRAERRAEERAETDPAITRSLRQRDARDARVNPFEPAPGAIVVDTSDRAVEETLDHALAIVRERLPEGPT